MTDRGDAGTSRGADLAAVAANQVLAIRVPARTENVPALRRLLAAFGAVHGARGKVGRNIALAVSEAATNAIVHGSGRDGSRSVDVVAEYRDRAIEIVIGDDGPGLAANVDSDGLGLGLGLIALSCAQFTVRDREPHGTVVWMRFEI